jgi:hypothetical protein
MGNLRTFSLYTRIAIRREITRRHSAISRPLICIGRESSRDPQCLHSPSNVCVHFYFLLRLIASSPSYRCMGEGNTSYQPRHTTTVRAERRATAKALLVPVGQGPVWMRCPCQEREPDLSAHSLPLHWGRDPEGFVACVGVIVTQHRLAKHRTRSVYAKRITSTCPARWHAVSMP